MRERLIDGLIQGDPLAWGALGVLWLLTTVLVLAHPSSLGARPAQRQALPPDPPARPRPVGPWTFLLLAAATATSLAGLPLASAIAVPRVRWKTVDAPDLVLAGGETWRRLRGPAVVVAGPPPDVAVPTVLATAAADRWVLLGLLSGTPVEGLPAALPAPNDPAIPRLCRTDADGCRPWPVAWPDPGRPPPFAELFWTPSGPSGRPFDVETAFAYDIETGLYLRMIDPPAPPPPSGAPAAEVAEDRPPSHPVDLGATFLELVGRVTSEAPRQGTSVLFTVRRVSGGRLRAARVVATPLPSAAGAGTGSGGHAFHLQRADVSLTAGPRALRWFARPVLMGTSFALPLGLLVMLVAPAALRRGRRGKDAEGAAVRVGRWLEAAAVLLAGIAAAAPAVVAMVSLWGAR